MRGILGIVATFLLRSFVISFLIFLMIISLVSGEFPPDLGATKRTFSSLHQLVQMGEQFKMQYKMNLQQRNSPKATGIGSASGEKLLHPSVVLKSINEELDDGPSQKPVASDSPGLATSSAAEIQSLRLKVTELETQLFRLQSRLANLETRSK